MQNVSPFCVQAIYTAKRQCCLFKFRYKRLFIKSNDNVDLAVRTNHKPCKAFSKGEGCRLLSDFLCIKGYSHVFYKYKQNTRYVGDFKSHGNCKLQNYK